MRKLLFISMLLLKSVGFQCAYAIEIPFGSTGKIVYHGKNGAFSIQQHGDIWLMDAHSTATVNERLLNSRDYTRKKHSKEPFRDSAGSGTKHVVWLTKEGLPDLQQIFYSYDNRDYIVMELVVSDKAVKRSSNNLVPLNATISDIQTNMWRSLCVPFDNDTFISYDSKAVDSMDCQVSAEVGALYQEAGRSGMVFGSLEHHTWKSAIRTAKKDKRTVEVQTLVGYTEKNLTRDDMPHGTLTGNEIRSAKFFVGKFADWRLGMDSYANHVRALQKRVVFEWRAATPVAWNSWGSMQEHITYEKMIQVTDFFADSVAELVSGQSVFIDLDSYWDNLLSGGLAGDYSALKQFADYAKSRGLKPGAYWAPFVDWGFGAGPDREVEGSDYRYGDIWTKVEDGYHDLDGTRALDPTHPGTRQRLALVIGKLKECGFEMIKIDFLGHAAIEATAFHDREIKTGLQAYQSGMEYLVEQLDSQMLIYAAISPSMATAPYVHMRRIACDAFNTIEHTRYTLNAVTYGWWQTHLYDYIDADHVVFKDASENENFARAISSFVTGTVVLGDDFTQYGPWHQRTKDLFDNPALWPIIENGRAFTPVETDQYASRIFVRHGVDHSYVALFNYDGREQSLVISAERLGLDKGATYQLVNLEDGSVFPFTTEKAIPLDAKAAKVFKVLRLHLTS